MISRSSTYWALDRQGGGKVLVTPDNRQLYSNSIRYIRLDKEPIPTETQDILGQLDKQHAEGIAREEFTQEDVDRAAEGMKSRKFRREERSAPPADLVPPTTATAAPAAQATPEKVTLAEGEATVPKKKAAKKKSVKAAKS